MGEPLVVELVQALEREGIPRNAYHLQDYVDVESLERVIETAPDDAEFRFTVEGIPVTITRDGVRIRNEDGIQYSGMSEGDEVERTSSTSPRFDIYEWTIGFVMDHLPADSVIIAEAHGPHLVPVASNDDSCIDHNTIEPIVASIPGQVYEKDQSCNIPDLQDVRGATTSQQAAPKSRPRSFIAAPITDIGVITATSQKPAAFTGANEETLVAVSDLIDTLLQNDQFSSGLQSEELLEEITDILSHDLTNKVTTATGFLDLAKQTQEPEFIEKAMDSVTAIESMADMLVTLGRTGDPIEELVEIDLAENAEELFTSMNGGELRILESGIVRADPTCLRRILHNVLKNAIDHGSEDVTIELGVLEDGFYVADDGPGFPEEVIDTAFQPGVTWRGNHHGIGLTIVNRLADAHGWTVAISDEATGGARIEFTDVTIPKSA